MTLVFSSHETEQTFANVRPGLATDGYRHAIAEPHVKKGAILARSSSGRRGTQSLLVRSASAAPGRARFSQAWGRVERGGPSSRSRSEEMARADGTKEERSTTRVERRVISVGGVFDTPTASALHACLAEMSAGTGVVLDFSHARDVSDIALVVFLRDLGELRARVSLWGLSQHHQRLLAYLDLGTGRGPSR